MNEWWWWIPCLFLSSFIWNLYVFSCLSLSPSCCYYCLWFGDGWFYRTNSRWRKMQRLADSCWTILGLEQPWHTDREVLFFLAFLIQKNPNGDFPMLTKLGKFGLNSAMIRNSDPARMVSFSQFVDLSLSPTRDCLPCFRFRPSVESSWLPPGALRRSGDSDGPREWRATHQTAVSGGDLFTGGACKQHKSGCHLPKDGLIDDLR